jgi:hypothetical protein
LKYKIYKQSGTWKHNISLSEIILSIASV